MTTEQSKPDGHRDQPVTQAEFTAAMGAIKQDLDRIDGWLDQMATKAELTKLRGEMASMKDEIIRHFKGSLLGTGKNCTLRAGKGA